MGQELQGCDWGMVTLLQAPVPGGGWDAVLVAMSPGHPVSPGLCQGQWAPGGDISPLQPSAAGLQAALKPEQV